MQDEWIADWEDERQFCSTHHGPISECADDDADWFPQRSVCQPTMQLEAVKRRYERLHEKAPFHDGSFKSWVKEASDEHPFHYADGVGFWMSREDLTPDDDFLEQGSVAKNGDSGTDSAHGEPEKSAEQQHA